MTYDAVPFKASVSVNTINFYLPILYKGIIKDKKINAFSGIFIWKSNSVFYSIACIITRFLISFVKNLCHLNILAHIIFLSS